VIHEGIAMLDPRKLLSFSPVYRAFQDLMGGNARREYVRLYLQPAPGMRVLDIGCGPGDILRYLDPSIQYTGVDLSPAYIAHARKNFGDRGRFLNESVNDLTLREPASFDRVMANGLFHHLDDAEARQLLDVAQRALKPAGRFVSIDCCYEAGQSAIARYLINKDRGNHVRRRAEYVALAREVFPDATYEIRHNLARVPYTHLIMMCPQREAASEECRERVSRVA
jgi:cyclopropane fatty-acyl-phospholipid synthase-like methyltransferase